MDKNTFDNNCPLCKNSSNISKLNSISRNKTEKFFCWNCTAIWPKRKNSFIKELKNKGETYSWGRKGSDVVKNHDLREKLIEWKINYLEKIFKEGGNNSKIIDFGCGPGIALEACQRLGVNAIGIESDRVNYDYCNSRGFEIIWCDFNEIDKISDLIKDDGTLILFNNSLIYNKDIFNLMNKINPRKLNIDIAIHDQNYFLNTRNPIQVLDSRKSGFMFSTGSLEKLMQSSNFKICYSKNYFGSHFLLARYSRVNLKEIKLSFFRKLIYFIYAYNLYTFTPIISFLYLKIFQPIKDFVKIILKSLKKISIQK